MTDERPKMKRVVLYLVEEDYNRLRAKLILTGKTVSAWLRDVIKQYLQS